MDKLPISINKHIFRFLSHPAADAVRNRISEYKAFSSNHKLSHLHTFYIFLLEQKVDGLPQILDELYDRAGSAWASVAITADRVCGIYTRAFTRDIFKMPYLSAGAAQL